VTAHTKSRGSKVALQRVRWGGWLAAVAALAALIAIGPPDSARAAAGTGYDQITGAGTTSSAITVNWTQGVLDSSNTPIATANSDRMSDTGPLSFMYPDFQNLQVTVSQTQDITHQGITITWQGAQPTIDNAISPQANFLQIMECYGDATTGPSPQDCEFGADELPGQDTNSVVDTRTGDLCPPNSSPNPPNGLDSLGGSSAIFGCDPGEPVQGANPPDIDPSNPGSGLYTIPFVPVSDPTSPAYSQEAISQYFNQFTTNEIPEAITGSGGTGQVQFDAVTGNESPGLGCGDSESNGQTENCWLVIVPRGEYEPNGFKVPVGTDAASSFIYSSPLSASNWANRIQIHLSYAAIGTFCPIGTEEIQTVGTQVAARAVQSWQLALNSASNCARVYGYSAVPEATSTQQLSQPTGTAGLAFTTIPIGSEAARDNTPAVTLPTIVYAPVAVSAVGFGFNISGKSGYITTPVKLTPDLLAKALTQVYRTDLPDYNTNPGAGVLPSEGPAWSQSNPQDITEDPEFQKLNPEVTPTSPPWSLAPLLTEDHSAINQQIWNWIQADPAATAWLDQGTTTATNPVAADPDFESLQLGTSTDIDSFPRAYSGILDIGEDTSSSPPKPETKDSLDLLPYVNNYSQAASTVLAANNPTTAGWDSQALAPDGSLGWWDTYGPEPIGQIFMWGISDTPDLAAYGLIDAQLCNDDGSNCVGPSTASLTAALDSATPDSAGLLEVNPADPGAGGYPLTQVTYAAVDTTRSAADLTDYADLIAYAVGAGQTPGVAPGDLPPGYLPLPASLQNQALAVVAELRADAASSASASVSPSASSQNAGSGASPSSGGQLSPASTSSPGSAVFVVSNPSAVLASTRTPRQPVGVIRWALLVVVVTGASCAAGGAVLRSASPARWLRRRRP
jgi:hypothetical protein